MYTAYTGSPVKHSVKSGAAVVAFGDGLIMAYEGKPANFVVNSKGQRGELSVHITGQSDCSGFILFTTLAGQAPRGGS